MVLTFKRQLESWVILLEFNVLNTENLVLTVTTKNQRHPVGICCVIQEVHTSVL